MEFPKQLVEIRKQWENNLVPSTVIMNEHKDTCLVVAQHVHGKETEYYCFRYFVTGGEWVCSVDGERLDINAVLSWLNAPSARSTQAGHYIYPITASDLK